MEFTFFNFHKELVFLKTRKDGSNIFNVFIFRLGIYKEDVYVDNHILVQHVPEYFIDK